MNHGFLKPAPPAIAEATGHPTIIYPPDNCAVNITPLEMNGKIHPDTAASEFGAYMIIGREVTVKRFLAENPKAVVYHKGSQELVVSKWRHNKTNKAMKDVQMGASMVRTIANAAAGSAQESALVGGGTAARAAFDGVVHAYYANKEKTIDLDKVPDPDGTYFKQVQNFFKNIKDNLTGDRIVLMVSVLASPPKVAGTYKSGKTTLTFSNLAAIMKGI